MNANIWLLTFLTGFFIRMRAILIDWLVEVHLKFKLIPETLYLAHNLIDRLDISVDKKQNILISFIE